MVWMVALLLLALAFVFVSGANDGSTIVGLALRGPATPGVLAILLLLGSLIVVPVLLGFAVADTFVVRLADFGDEDGAATFVSGAVSSLLVVGLLAWRGIPTSLTLALIGGLTGAGLTAGAEVSASRVAGVLAIGAVAPFVGGGLAYLFGRLARRSPVSGGWWTRVTHLVSYLGQCVAYAANDGQKMFAVVAMASATTAGVVRHGADEPRGVEAVTVPAWLLAITAVVFGLGVLTSLLRVGGRLGRGVALARPGQVVSTEASSAIAVLGSSFLGTPVSMSQSVAAGVVGVAASEGSRRVRWPSVLGIASAWLWTLPLAMAVGAVAGVLVRMV